MPIRNRKLLKALAIALCCTCFSLSASAAARPSLLTSPDGARESSIVASQKTVHVAQGKRDLTNDPQLAGLPLHTAGNPAELLTDEELAELAARAEEPGKDVVGGALDNQHLTYIVIALAAAVVVLIAK